MKFMKWQGAGNDFILMQALEMPKDALDNLPLLAKQVCHRQFGIGADGLMVVLPSETADFKMAYFNSDGSYAAMCGNGLRCFSAYCSHLNLTSQSTFTVETGDGIKKVQLECSNGYQVVVDMGQPIFVSSQVPTTLSPLENEKHLLEVAGERFYAYIMRMGVPHAVVDLDMRQYIEADFKHYGAVIEKMACFPEGINVNFVRLQDDGSLRVDTWERGAGLTLACGTGVCASAYAFYTSGKVSLPVRVAVAGGLLSIDVQNGSVFMKGPAKPIAAGEYYSEFES